MLTRAGLGADEGNVFHTIVRTIRRWILIHPSNRSRNCRWNPTLSIPIPSIQSRSNLIRLNRSHWIPNRLIHWTLSRLSHWNRNQ